MLFVTMAGFDGPIYLALGDSKLLARSMLFAHAAAFVIVTLTVPAPGYRWALLCVIALNGVRVNYRLKHASGDDVVSLLLTETGRWSLRLRDGRVLAADLVATAVVSLPLTALHLRQDDGRKRHIALLPDNVAADAYRRLRVRLRFGSAGTMRPDSEP